MDADNAITNSKTSNAGSKLHDYASKFVAESGRVVRAGDDPDALFSQGTVGDLYLDMARRNSCLVIRLGLEDDLAFRDDACQTISRLDDLGLGLKRRVEQGVETLVAHKAADV